MNMNHYQELAGRTINPKLNDNEMTMHALHGLAGEVGEVHSLFQKVYQGHELDTEHLKKEIGDVLWFVTELCTACGFKLNDIAEMNIDKLKNRYPDGFDCEKSQHRAAGDI